MGSQTGVVGGQNLETLESLRGSQNLPAQVGGGHCWPPLPPELVERCRSAFVSQMGVPSRTQREVSEALRALGASVLEEERCQRSGYGLDALAGRLGIGGHVAVEVDGPSHFVGRSRLPTGATLLKRRQLRHFGWRLASVPYWEWDALSDRDDADEELRRRRRYLQRRLDEVARGGQGGGGDRNHHTGELVDAS